MKVLLVILLLGAILVAGEELGEEEDVLSFDEEGFPEATDESDTSSDDSATDEEEEDAVEEFPGIPEPLDETHEIPLDSKNWEKAWNAPVQYVDGTVTGNPPIKVGAGTSTSAVLLFSKKQAKDFIVQAVCKTTKYTRDKPNTWEVFWLAFNVDCKRNAQHPEWGYDMSTKSWNNFFLKDNGYEIGTASNTLGQTFLKTGSFPKLALDTYYVYWVKKVGQTMSAYVGAEGSSAMPCAKDYTSTKLYDQKGMLGLYAEDAEFVCKSVRLKSLDESEEE